MTGSIAQQEAVMRAVLEKPPAAPPPRNSPQEAAAKIRDAVTEKGPRSALVSLRQRQPIKEREISKILDSNIGTERGTDGSKNRPVGSGERTRFEDAQKYAALAKDFQEKGYDGLNTAQKNDIGQFVERAMRAWPEADILLTSMSPTDRRAVIETILKTPEYAAKVRSVFQEAIDPSKILQDTVPEISTKFEEVKKQEDAKRVEVAKNNTDRTLVDTQLDQFADRTAGGGVKGAKLIELEKIERDLPTLAAGLETSQDSLAQISDRLKDLENSRRVALSRGNDTTDIDAELTAKRGEARTLQREITTSQDAINRKAVLEQERAGLEPRRQHLEEEKIRLEGELTNLTRDRITAQTELASEKLSRASQEQDFVDSLKNVFSESTMQYLEEKIAAAEEVQRQLIEEEKARTTDPAEKAILDSLLSRWERQKTIGILGKRKITELNPQAVNRDFGVLMTAGPNQVMRDILIARGIPAGEADAKLADPAFIEKMQPQVIERLITRRIQTGKLTEDDARRIIESDWGSGMVEKAIANRQGIRDTIAKLREEGVLRGGVGEWFKNKSNGSIWKFLLLLLAGVLVIPAAGMAVKNLLSEP